MKRIILIVLTTVLCFFSPHILAKTKVVHVVVALCDNKYQGIVPVPAKIGNGQDPTNNLYWGAAYGVKTFMKKQPNWTLISSIKGTQNNILERLIFKHKTKDVYMVADAYDGQFIQQTIQGFYQFIAGTKKEKITVQQKNIMAGGGADLVVYVGHNALMDFSLARFNLKAPKITDQQIRTQNSQRQAAVFACKSKPYFLPQFERTGIRPAMMTTNYMAPEAYVLNALVNSWVAQQSAEQTREAVARSYAQYQKISVKSAKGLFATQ
ncbi:hypothetical protein [Neisseria sp. Ec49-e6-T10]|uniref:hypothetical protein n=1 Tax=Neisseria sp. Ec49-e6-T10 TaxID=3140744 RepID=UPI003EBE5810